MIGIVVSRADEASEGIGQQLLELEEWRESTDSDRSDGDGGGTVYRLPGFEIRTFDALHLELEGVGRIFSDVDLIVFASRHSGDSGPLLTTHFTGNVGAATNGGRDGTVATACPAAQDRLLSALIDHCPDGYAVGVECTHHGPSEVGTPSMFAELGSGPEQWTDRVAARAVARAILDIRATPPNRDKQLVGFGGGHYAPRFERIIRETDWAVGHIAADWALDALGDVSESADVIRQLFTKSRAEFAVIDGDRQDIERIVHELGHRIVSETWVRETTRVPLETVDSLEGELGSIEEGVRFGEPASAYRGPIELVELPDSVLNAARAVDSAAVRSAIDRRCLAYTTTEGASKAVGTAAVVRRADRDALIDDLVAILSRVYEVDRESNAILLHERAFDPDRARELGVPEGPAFGRLSDGESVVVDGREIDPTRVHVERTRRLSIE